MPAANPETIPPSDVRVVHRQRSALVAAGAVTFGATYIGALVTGFFTLAEVAAEPCGDCRKRATAVVVPVAGPLLLWDMTPARSRGSALWPAAWSGVQAVGVALLVIGVVGHDVPERRPLNGRPTVSVVPAFSGQLGALSLNVSW